MSAGQIVAFLIGITIMVGIFAFAVPKFAVYSFSRLLSAIPITPGGVGVIDLGYIAGLTAFYGTEKAQIVAAVLIFRVLTFGIQIPLGAVTYVIWRRTKRWLRDEPPPGSIAAELGSVDAGTQPVTAGS